MQKLPVPPVREFKQVIEKKLLLRWKIFAIFAGDNSMLFSRRPRIGQKILGDSQMMIILAPA